MSHKHTLKRAARPKALHAPAVSPTCLPLRLRGLLAQHIASCRRRRWQFRSEVLSNLTSPRGNGRKSIPPGTAGKKARPRRSAPFPAGCLPATQQADSKSLLPVCLGEICSPGGTARLCAPTARLKADKQPRAPHARHQVTRLCHCWTSLSLCFPREGGNQGKACSQPQQGQNTTRACGSLLPCMG